MDRWFPKISIIIPVFRSEATIERAVRSALAQNYPDIELIVVDDGSPDGSAGIIEAIAEEDDRVKIISQENLGVSAARNAGIRSMNGEWFMTLDADDYLDTDAALTLYQAARRTDADLMICGFRYVYENGRREEVCRIEDDYTDEKAAFIDNMFIELYDKHLISTHSNKLYRTSLVREHGIYYNEYLAVNEDIDFVLRYMKHCDIIGAVRGVYFNYYQHGGAGDSLNKTFRPYGIASALLIVKDADDLLEDVWVNNRTISAVNERLFLHICSYIGLMYILSGYSREREVAELKELRNQRDFLDFLKETSPSGIKERTAHFLLRFGLVLPYHALCRALYLIPAGQAKSESEALAGEYESISPKEPYVRLGIYSGMSEPGEGEAQAEPVEETAGLSLVPGEAIGETSVQPIAENPEKAEGGELRAEESEAEILESIGLRLEQSAMFYGLQMDPSGQLELSLSDLMKPKEQEEKGEAAAEVFAAGDREDGTEKRDESAPEDIEEKSSEEDSAQETGEIERISLNSASKEELMSLRGIGERRAVDIIRLREELGGFESRADILRVPGIGRALFESIKDRLSL